MASSEGVNIVISGDSSQLVQSVREAQNALSSMKNRKIDIAVQIAGGLQEAGAKIESLFGSIFKSITAGATSVAGAISLITKSALSIGGGFEAQMTSVQVISGAAGDDLQELTDKAREMGATLPITAKDAATAMTLLAQRGMQARDILASVAEVANLTISQGVDMGSAADLLGSTMTNFGISVNDASKITAIFNNACNQSALSMGKLIEAMKYVGPAAGSVDMSLTEAVSAMEAIANAGLTGEMTGTGLAMVMSKLASATRIMGVNTKELDGSLRPLKDIFSELKDAGFSLSDAIAAFGQRGSKAALALAKNSKDLAKNEERLKQWGSTQAAVDAKAKTFTNTMAALQSAIEELHIEIFEQIKDQSKGAVSSVAELTREFSKWVGETQIAGKSLNSFLEGLGFKLPSGAGFKELLKQFDVQAFVDKVKNFGSTLKGIGESIAGFFNMVKTPLTWLITHLDTFAAISFWGWILGKGLQIPAAIMGIVTSFNALYTSVKGFLSLSWANLIPLLTTPAGLVGAGVGIATYAASRMSAADDKLRKALDEEKRYLSEQAKADLLLPVEIQFDFKTGFEKLPEAWAKASDNIRAQANAAVKDLQTKFRDRVSEAILAVMAKFPELADAFRDSAGNITAISDSTLRQISSALHGDEEAFKALPEHLKVLTAQINSMRFAAGEGGVELTGMLSKYQQVRKEIEKPLKKPETTVFFEELSANIKNITANLSGEIERANKFLSGSDGQLAVNVSLSQAQKKLDDFIKNISEKYAVPEDIVRAGVFANLQKLAQAGDTTAQSLINGFSSAGDTLNTFLSNAQEAITYLEASPDKFMPALNSMMKGIQRVDPLTGKLTEKFKKAHDALKQWSNVTFDQLSSRIQKLRKAVEGGFIDKSALEAELKRVMPQLKMKVVADLQPQREQYRTQSDFQSVVASELISRVSDLFGDMGLNMASKMLNGKTGSEMGRSILNEVERGLSGTSGTFQINGIDQLQKCLSSIATLPMNISEAVSQNSKLPTPPTPDNSGEKDYSASITQIVTGINSLYSGIQEVSSAVNSGANLLFSILDNHNVPADSLSYSGGRDYYSEIAQVIAGIQALTAEAKSLQPVIEANSQQSEALSSSVKSQASYVQALSSAMNDLANSVNVLQSIIKDSAAGNSIEVNLTQQGFNIQSKDDADYVAQSAYRLIKSGLGNGGV